MNSRIVGRRWQVAVAGLVAAAGVVGLGAQSFERIQQERVRSMLQQVQEAIKESYYDPSFGGRDIDAHFRAAAERLAGAPSYSHALAVIAQAVTDLDDSHTYFDPPSRSSAVDYGWRQAMVGDTCLVTAVRPGSDAEAKGLKAGDAVLAIEGMVPTRETLWKIDYLFYILNRRATIRIDAQSPGGQPRTLDINARIRPFPRKLDVTTPEGVSDVLRELDNGTVLHRFREKDGVVIWKMAAFDVDRATIDYYMRSRVKRARALILDLRGNPGGYVETLEQLVSHFFDHDVQIAERRGRKKMKPIVAHGRGEPFAGPVVVIVDSQSASAAEVFARVMQIEKRGRVIGDVSEGAVMQSEDITGKLSAGSDSVIVFTTSVTTADLIMADGRSLERVGVTPDERAVPTPADLAAHRDPALVRAVELAGGRLTPEASGRLFPVEWRK